MTILTGSAAPQFVNVTAVVKADQSNIVAAVSPNPVPAGEGVLIYGRLKGPNSGERTIRLYHHLVGSGRGYARIGTTTTDPLDSGTVSGTPSRMISLLP